MFVRPAGRPFTHGIFVSDARCSGAAGIEDCAGQEGSCTVFSRAMNRSPKSDVGGVSGVRITGSDHRDEHMAKTTTNKSNKYVWLIR